MDAIEAIMQCENCCKPRRDAQKTTTPLRVEGITILEEYAFHIASIDW